MKKITKILTTSLVILVLFLAAFRYLQLKNNSVVTAFNDSSLSKLYSQVNIYAKCEGNYFDTKDRKKIVNQVAEKLMITDLYTVDTKYENGRDEYILRKNSDSADTEISFISIENGQKDNSINVVQYLSAEIKLYNNIENIMEYYNILEKVFEELNLEGKAKISFHGDYNGEVSTEEKENIICEYCEKLDAKIQQAYLQGDLYVMYGYTNKFKDFIMDGKDKVNLCIQMDYDEVDNVTKFTLSMP